MNKKNIYLKLRNNIPVFLDRFLERFDLDFGLILDSFWSLFRPKIQKKDDSRRKTTILRRNKESEWFFNDFPSRRGSKCRLLGPGTHFFDVRKRRRFLHRFLDRKSHQNEPKMVPKSRGTLIKSIFGVPKVLQGPPDDPQGLKSEPQGSKITPKDPKMSPRE